MEFQYIRKLKPFIILAMVLIFMPIITKSGNIVPSEFYGFTVTSDNIVVTGDNVSVTGWKDNKKVFSFELPLNTDYALSVNQNNNIVIYTKNARLIFAQDGTPLTATESDLETYEALKKKTILTTPDGTTYALTNRYAYVNTITEIKNGTAKTVYSTPTAVLLVEFAFWEGNLILIVTFIAGFLDVRKRRFSKNVNPFKLNNNSAEKTQNKSSSSEGNALPKLLKAFTKPEISNKGAAFSNEYSTKPGETQGFRKQNNSEQTLENTDNTKENDPPFKEITDIDTTETTEIT